MGDEIFKRVGNDLSEEAIRGLIQEEITSHDSEEVVLPRIKFKPVVQEEVVKIPKKEAPKPESLFKVSDAGDLLRGSGENVIKLPGSLTSTAKLRKAYRYRRFGEPLVKGKYKREQLPVPEVQEADKKKLKMKKVAKRFYGAELLLPAIILFLLFSWMPIIKTFMISLQNFSTMHDSAYVGFANFAKIINDAKFWQAFLHSVSLSAIVVVLGTWLPLFLALYVYEMKKGSGIIKIIYFIPFLTPAVPAAILWKWMYNEGFGLINSVLSLFVRGDVHIGWLTDSKLVLLSIAIVFVWKNTGWAMLIYMAGMQNIPKVLFEDAALFGANVWTKIKTIVLPALAPVILAVVFIQVITGMQVFSEVYIMTNGGPEGSSEVISTYIYKKAFLYMDIGYASGVAVFFLLILISISMLRMSIVKKRR